MVVPSTSAAPPKPHRLLGPGREGAPRLRRALEATEGRTTSREVRAGLSHVGFLGSSEGMVTNQSIVVRPGGLVAEVSIGRLPAASGRSFEVALGSSGGEARVAVRELVRTFFVMTPSW